MNPSTKIKVHPQPIAVMSEDKVTFNRTVIKRTIEVPNECLAFYDALKKAQLNIDTNAISGRELQHCVFVLEELRSFFLQTYMDSISGHKATDVQE